MRQTNDPFELVRFVDAQAGVYEAVLGELQGGRKETHWMWFVFPQMNGLGISSMARRYAINSKDEAEAFLRHHVLGPRLFECCHALLSVEGKSAREILGAPDDVKLRSAMTLFAAVSKSGSVFEQVLDRFFDGMPDQRTLEILANDGVGS